MIKVIPRAPRVHCVQPQKSVRIQHRSNFQVQSLKNVVSVRPFQTAKILLDRKYTKEHEWIEITKGDEANIGISDFAQSALGDVVYVDLPEVGASFKKKDTLVAVESVKAASDVYAPVSGTVVAVNASLKTDPSIVNKSPYSEGWMVKLKIKDKKELDSLLDEAAYKKHCEEESSKH